MFKMISVSACPLVIDFLSNGRNAVHLVFGTEDGKTFLSVTIEEFEPNHNSQRPLGRVSISHNSQNTKMQCQYAVRLAMATC